jgi:hypothetical protein
MLYHILNGIKKKKKTPSNAGMTQNLRKHIKSILKPKTFGA